MSSLSGSKRPRPGKAGGKAPAGSRSGAGRPAEEAEHHVGSDFVLGRHVDREEEERLESLVFGFGHKPSGSLGSAGAGSNKKGSTSAAKWADDDDVAAAEEEEEDADAAHARAVKAALADSDEEGEEAEEDSQQESGASSDSSSSSLADRRASKKGGAAAAGKQQQGKKKDSAAAWEDEDDAHVKVKIADKSRLRKLRKEEKEALISGKELTQRLREQFDSRVKKSVSAGAAAAGAGAGAGGEGAGGASKGWADITDKEERRKQKEKKVADRAALKAAAAAAGREDSLSTSEEEEEELDEEEEDGTAALRSTGGILSSRGGPLPSGRLNITRVRDANRAEPSKAVVQSIGFHPDGAVLFTAGLDHKLRFFSIDGKKNPKVSAVHFEDLPIASAGWNAEGTEVIVTGRRPFFYSYSVATGATQRVPRILGREEKSLESAVFSPFSAEDGSGTGSSHGSLISFLGNDGNIILCSARTKQWVSTLKMNGSVRSACFTREYTPSPYSAAATSAAAGGPGAAGGGAGGHGALDLLSVGGAGEVYRWDLRMMKCRERHADEGSTGGTAIAATADGRWYAVGSTMGVVNVYDSSTTSLLHSSTTSSGSDRGAVSTPYAAGGAGASSGLFSGLGSLFSVGSGSGSVTAAASAAGGAAAAAKPWKSSLHLTTAINTLSYNHDGSMLAVGSQRKQDAFRLLHGPTVTAFSNWPTSKTPLHYVTCQAFSPNSGYLAMGNDRGRVLLYRVNHFSQA